MAEVAASTVFHSFFTSAQRVVVTRPSSSKLTLDGLKANVKAVTKPRAPRRHMTCLATPQSLAGPVEEVPLEEECRRWLVEYGFHGQFFAMAHNLWTTDRDRLFMYQEIVPRRSSYLKTTISSFLSLPRISASISPLHALLRYASTSAASHSTDSNIRSPLQFLHRNNVYSPTYDPEAGWTAYTHLREAGSLDTLSVRNLITFAEGTISHVEQVRNGTDVEFQRSWGIRMAELLQDLFNRIGKDKRAWDFRFALKKLTIRAFALRGDFKSAENEFKKLLYMLEQTKTLMCIEDARGSQLLSVWRHQGSAGALDFMDQHWNYIKRSAVKKERPKDDPEVKALRRQIRQLIGTISSPLDVLRQNAKQWGDVKTYRLARLVMEVFCAQGRPEDAFAIDQFMVDQDHRVHAETRLQIVRAYVEREDVEKANAMFADITDTSSEAELKLPYYLSTGIMLYARQGRVEDAHALFAQLQEPTSDDILLLMQSSAHRGDIEEVVRTFEHMFPPKPDGTGRQNNPTTQHYGSVIFAHAQAEDSEGVREWLLQMNRDGVAADYSVYQTVLRSFAMRGDIESVATILDQMRRARQPPTVYSYTAVIKLLANKRNPAAAEALYARAIREGIVPDRHMMTTLMNAHAESGSWSGVIRTFDYMNTHGVPMSIEVYNTLLKAYVLIGTPFRIVSKIVRRLHESNISPDPYTYSLLIQSACDNKLMDVARDLFYEMDELSSRGIRPDLRVNAYVMTMIMAGYLRAKDTELATKVFEDMQDRGITPGAVTYAHIVKEYASQRTDETLQLAFDFIQGLLQDPNRRNVWLKSMFGRATAMEVLLSPLLAAYVHNRDKVIEVEQLLEQLVAAGEEPSLGLLVFLLDAYRRAFDIEAVNQIWPQVLERCMREGGARTLFRSNQPAVQTASRKQTENARINVPLSMYIDAQSAAGAHDKVAMVWKQLTDMGVTFDANNWNHLAVALVRAGEPVRAFEVVERIILPNDKRMQRYVRLRRKNPDSPLVVDEFAGGEDDPAADEDLAPFSEKNLRDSYERASNVKVSTRKIMSWLDSSPEHENDYVRPLHQLQQFSAMWKTWAPHNATLSALAAALERLGRGRPVRPRRSFPPAASVTPTTDIPSSAPVSDTPQVRPRKGAVREYALGLLARIKHESPRTLHLLRAREQRLERKGYIKGEKRSAWGKGKYKEPERTFYKDG